MKKILLMALILTGSLSTISCTADTIEDQGTTSTRADGEPGNTPIKPPPPPPPVG